MKGAETTMSTQMGNGEAGRRLAVRALVWVVSAAGLWAVALGVTSPELEWRALALVALAFLTAPMWVETSSRRGGLVRFSPVHAVLFAGSLALGPVASVPAAFAGASGLLSSGRDGRALSAIASALLTPAVACCVSAAAYAWAGGSAAFPQQVSSVISVMAAAVAYASVTEALAALGCGAECDPRLHTGERQVGPMALARAWFPCLAGGYTLAVLYATAPTYVIVAPAAVAALVWFATREGVVASSEAETETTSDSAEPDEDTPLFIDASTGLATRRYLEMFLASEVGRAERFGKDVSLAIFDLDSFAQLCESGGSQAVDRVVGELGRALQGELRDYDIVARYSAGRLAVVLPETGPDQALEVAERLHSTLSSVVADGESVSVSVGVASCPEYASTPDELVNSAHRALNRGRFQGPSSVCGCRRLDRAS